MAKSILTWLVKAYVFLMLVVYPLYFQDKYYDMSDAKWAFYRNVSAFFALAAAVILIWHVGCFVAGKKTKEFFAGAVKNLNATDCFVIAYLLTCCISTLITPYRRFVIWGFDGWYMGLIAQLSFGLIYFLVSRFWRWEKLHLLLILAAAALVFFLGVIMRFRIDPMGMYGDLDDYYLQHFISTLGQTTWYSSYMCIVFPLGLIAYCCAQKTWLRIAAGVFCVIGFLTFVTQNSDSAYVAMFGIFFLLFWISFASDERFLRFLECLVMALGSFKFMGLLQLLFADRMVGLDSLSIFMSQSVVTLILLVAVVLLYLFMRLYVFKKTEFHVTSLKKLRIVMLVLLVLGTAAVVIYVCLNTAGKLPAGLSSGSNYLVFNDAWGNNRGVSWRCTIDGYFRADPLRKLFGVGPDSFAEYIYTYYQADLDKVLGRQIIQACAHNEWLNALLNTGVLGLAAYLGTFVSSFADCMKGAERHPYLHGVAMAIAAYIFHNFFCYQQIICTPTIFILMGMAQSVIRHGDSEE
ncbi:MAG: O-antigen ligase family protein [Lachnospiraceae bacterium]|nr:O-antigen ligase family protein [Lachnospiraceae bacterium]